MGRPPKYPTAREAAEVQTVNKLVGKPPYPNGRTRESILSVACRKCDICGTAPDQEVRVDRVDDSYTVIHNNIQFDNTHTLQPICRTCLVMLQNFSMSDLISWCAKLMARMKWGVLSKWVF